jgi:hypothetical protein
MSRTSGSGMLLGLVLIVGAFAAVATAWVVTAPAARADDPFTDIVAAVEGDFALGQDAFAVASSDFTGGDVADGLAAFYAGVDDDLLSVPNNLLQGSVEALTGQPVDSSLSWDFPVPAEFTDASVVAPTVFGLGEADFATAAADLASGDYTSGVEAGLQGVDYVSVIAPEFFVIGSAAGLGL